jgi:aldehyde dehydrogenase (NAD+)
VKAGQRGSGAARAARAARAGEAAGAPSGLTPSRPAIDRTYKCYIGGKQVRPDSGYSLAVLDHTGAHVAEVGLGNRKDIRNAVEAAHAAKGWSKATAHLRAQVLFYLGENLAMRAAEMAGSIGGLTGASAVDARAEVDLAIERIFSYAAWADKYDGRVHPTPFRNVTLAMPEPIGVMGVVAPDEPSLLGFLSVVLPPVAMGNAVIAIPSERWPLPALGCYQLFDTSDLPPGVVNIVTGRRDELAAVLASHDDVDAVWYFGSAEGSAEVEKLSAGNMKRTWVGHGAGRDWLDGREGAGEEFLREATQIKNIWIPYGA